MNRILQCSLITLGAAGLFVGLRSLPDTECGFLHYEPPVVDSDGIQFCGVDEPVFIEVGELKYPVGMELMCSPAPRVGQPSTVTMELTTEDGRPIAPSALAITHTELMHVLVVDPSREDYQHVHPTPMGESGQWSFEFTPRRPGNYTLFTEFVPSRTQQVVMKDGQIEVPADSLQTAGNPMDLPEGWTAKLVLDPASPKVNLSSRLLLQIAREDGEPALLEPVMGAYAHLVAFDEGVSGFAHLHPKYTGQEKAAAPQLEFMFSTHRPGNYRIWAQVKVDGVERFIPFETVVN